MRYLCQIFVSYTLWLSRFSSRCISDTLLMNKILLNEHLTMANEMKDKWKLLQNETYIFKFLLSVSFNTPLYGHH